MKENKFGGFFWVWIGRKLLINIKVSRKKKFHRFKEHKTYSVDNILYVADSSSQPPKKYESRIAQNMGCNGADWPGEAILGTVKYAHSNLGAGKTSESQALGD